MHTQLLLIALCGLGVAAYGIALFYIRRRARPLGGVKHLPALPGYYAGLALSWTLLPSLLLALIWGFAEAPMIRAVVLEGLAGHTGELSATARDLLFSQLNNAAIGLTPIADLPPEHRAAVERLVRLRMIGDFWHPFALIGFGLVGLCFGLLRLTPRLNARHQIERLLRAVLFLSACSAVLTTIGIVFSVLFEALRFFREIPVWEFLFGLHWSPQTAIRADQVGGSGAFGFVPLLAGSLLISLIAMTVALPIGLLSAIYLSEYAHARTRAVVKPLLEILAGIPTVVYGFFAALVVGPALRAAGLTLGLDVAAESALAAGLVMGLMLIPFISSLSDDVLGAVPRSLYDGSLGLGATRSETIRRVVFPAALPGVVGGSLLALSRAIGETMIVVMAAGLAAKLTVNPLESVTTVTVQIVSLLVGDQEFDSAKTLAAFALGLVLFVLTLCLNVLALVVVRRYRERYD